jgi:hypothetical protein
MRRYKSTILILLFLAIFIPREAFSQPLNPLISFSVESCNLDEALEKLFAEYELNVVFSKAELSHVRIESYTCSYKSVEEVLTDLLRGTGFGFRKVGKQYVIRKDLPAPPENNTTQQEATVAPPQPVVTEPPVVYKRDTVVNKTADTIRIIDSVTTIRTVMRYDTVVEVKHEVEHDTVYTVKYKGLAFPWPSFKDNGWFITPAVTLSSMKIVSNNTTTEQSIALIPVSAYSAGMDVGYKYQRLGVGMSLSYKSIKYSFSFDQCFTEGDYYVNDTLDTYYVVHPSGDTTYQYILDSTYIPLTTTDFSWQDVNRVDYLSLGLFASIDFLKFNYFRMFAKAGIAADFAVSCSGSYIANEAPYHERITMNQVESVRLTYFGGLGMGFKAGNHFEIVPEVRYRQMSGSPYRTGFQMDMKLRYWDFRLGLSYYF